MGLLLGLGGYALAGKDAVADVLEREHGWARTFMSKPLMLAMLALDPLIPVGCGDPVRFSDMHRDIGYDASKRNPEVRRLLQALGTEVGRRMFGESVWVDLMIADVSEHLAAGRNVAVTGIRFRNELDAVHAAGGVTAWVERPGVGPVNGHASDNELGRGDFDLALLNDGGLDDLPIRVEGLLRRVQALRPVGAVA